MRPQEVQPFADALALRQIGEKGGEILFIGGGQRGVAINELDDVIALVHAMLDQRLARERADDVNAGHRRQIGRASCRERVCQSVSISVVGGSLKKKTMKKRSK